MLLIWDLNARSLVQSVGSSVPLLRAEAQRSASFPIEVAFVENGIQALVDVGAQLGVVVKPTPSYDGPSIIPPVALTPDGTSQSYKGTLNFLTSEINALFAADGDGTNDKGSINLALAIGYSLDSGTTWESSTTIILEVENNRYRGTEGTPAAVPSPEDWLTERAVRYDIVQSLDSTQKARARGNIGAGTGSGGGASSEITNDSAVDTATGTVKTALETLLTADTSEAAARAAADSALTTSVAAKLASSMLDTDGTLAANSDAKIASQKATVTFVAALVAALVASSPAALDTLNELAAALANDPNFATTMTNALAGKLGVNAQAVDVDPAGTAIAAALLSAASALPANPLLDASSGTSVDFYARQLLGLDGVTAIVDWGNGALKKGDGITVVDWGGGLLYDSLGITSIYWQYRKMYRGSVYANSLSIDWDNSDLYSASGNSALDWNNRQLLASDGTTVMLDWSGSAVGELQFMGALAGVGSNGVVYATGFFGDGSQLTNLPGPTHQPAADQAARLALTGLKNGDTVTQTDTNHVWLVIDKTATATNAGWQDLGFVSTANPVSIPIYDTGTSSLKQITLVNGILIVT